MNKADEILDEKINICSGNGLIYRPLFGEYDVNTITSKVINVAKSQGAETQPTNQKDANALNTMGIAHPVDIISARQLKDISSHHASCIQSKKYSTLGLGFVSDASEATKNKKTNNVSDTEAVATSLLTGESYIESKVDTVLDKLTLHGFMFELYKSAEDFLDGGTGYLEVVRDDKEKIVGINWMPYEDLTAAIIRDNQNRSRLVYKYSGSIYGGSNTTCSLFGKENRRWVWENVYKNGVGIEGSIEQVSEIIPFMIPSNRSKYYGYPEWLSASSVISLLSMAMQYKSDFYTNRGVLAFLLTVVGNIDGDKWKEIERLIQGSVGGGRNFKNLAISLPNEKSKVQVDKLATSDKTEQQFALDLEVFAQNIVSAHRVPPVLANILIPGKLGATNEAVQALVSFQLLVIGPYQTMIQKVLARTLGGDDGVEGLESEDFRLRTITSQFNITGLDAVGRAKEEAVGSNRDFSDGVKD